MDFRARLVGTLRAAKPLFEVEGVVVVGSEVPNLFEVGAASTLVISQDLDVGVPVARIAEVKACFPALRAAALEKLLSDRSGDKGARDALVVSGLLMVMSPAAVDELVALIDGLPADARHTVASNLTLLSLLERRPGMPDPVAGRSAVRALLERVHP